MKPQEAITMHDIDIPQWVVDRVIHKRGATVVWIKMTYSDDDQGL